MPAVRPFPLLNQIAVGEQHGRQLAVGGHLHAEPREIVRPVEEVGNAPETLRFALRAPGAVGAVKAHQPKVLFRLQGDTGFQHEAALRYQQGITWSEHAGRLESFLLSDLEPIYRSVLALPPT